MMMEIFSKYGYAYFIQLYLAADGKRSLAQLRDMMSLEFAPIEASVILKHAQALAKVGLLKLDAAPR